MAFLDHNRTLLADIPPALQSQDRALAWACSACFHTVALAVSAMAAVGLRELPKAPAPAARLEILLTDTQQAAEQATAADSQDQADQAAYQEAAAHTEASSPVVPHLSSSIQSASEEVVPAIPAQQTADLSSAMREIVPVDSPMPIERQIETVAPVSESYRTAAVAPSEAEPSPATETIAKNVHDHAQLSPPAPPDPSLDRTESTDAAAAGTSIATPTDFVSVSDSAAVSSGSSAASPTDTVAMNHPTITRIGPAQSQYGWLAELLRRRTKSLLAYPHMARTQGWEGIVVVRTTINSDGDLVDATVTKSSGYVALDEDALELMRRVCPIHLPQDLGKSQITMSIPIRYKIE